MHGQYVAATHNKLTRAVTLRANDRARTGSHFQRAKLIMITGDLPEAVALGTQALDWAGPLCSTRILDKLRDLNRLAEPHVNLPEVREILTVINAPPHTA